MRRLKFDFRKEQAMYKIIGGALIVGGGIYVALKTDFFKKAGEKLKKAGADFKQSFVEGYSDTIRA